MGIGSYGICNDEQQAVCIDMLEYAGAYEADTASIEEWHSDDVTETIYGALSKAFYSADKWDGDHHVIAESTLLTVGVCSHGDDIGLRVRIKDHDAGLDGLAYNAMRAASRRLFRKLHDAGLPLRVKTSGYTSAAYQPE